MKTLVVSNCCFKLILGEIFREKEAEAFSGKKDANYWFYFNMIFFLISPHNCIYKVTYIQTQHQRNLCGCGLFWAA